MTQPLTEQMQRYHSFMGSILDEDGFNLPHGIILDSQGQVTMLALALDPEQSYKVMLSQITKLGAVEAVWALDRYTQPGQGTQYGDVLAGQHFVDNPDKKMSECFRGFTIQYQYEPRVWGPVEYDNVWWTSALRRELMGASGGMFVRVQRAR